MIPTKTPASLRLSFRTLSALAALTIFSQSACSSSDEPGGPGVGGSPSTGGSVSSGGALSSGGAQTSGGAQASGGASTGGASTGGASSSGGAPGSGGATSTGGSSSGGAVASGGAENTGGSDQGTGGGGSAEFQPCPSTGPCKVLPLGDSITVGLNFDGGYRVQLFHLANQDNHDITFTGTQPPNGPTMVDGKPFSRKHEGISGQTIAQIADRVPSPGLGEMPHIILVHAGTNDMYQMPTGADDRLGDLMDELIEEAPDALIVFSNIIPFPSGAAAVTTFNAPIQGMVEERAAAGAHILFVDQFKDFDPNTDLGTDKVHPNEGGYSVMAAKWYAAIESYLP